MKNQSWFFYAFFLAVLFFASPASSVYSYGWDNSTALYRQVFDINYSKTDTILDYQQFLQLNTSIAYNATLAKCNFIAAWHPNGQATPVWVPTYVQPETCDAVYWNTTVKVKLPSLANTNGTLALYFGFPLDSSLSYANNSGNETFLLYDNGTTVAAATSLNVNLTSSSQVFYPGRWNLSVSAYSSTNNATYNNGEIILGHANACSGLCRTKLSTNYNLTDDLRIDYKFRMTGACSGDTLDGEFNTMVGWGGYSNIGIGSIDSPDSGLSASFGPGSGADPHFNGGGTSALMLKINNWSTTGAKATNMWVNLTAKWPVQNGLKLQTTGNPNYVTFVVASENATFAYSQLNGTTYTNISATNYCIDGTGCNNATVWRLPFTGSNNGTLSPATQNMKGRLLFDQREICSGGTQEYRIDELQISKFTANATATLIGPLEGQSGAGPSPSPSSCSHSLSYVDLSDDFNSAAGYCNLWYRDELSGDMTFNSTGNDKWYASTFPQAYFQNSTAVRTISGFTGTTGGTQPYTVIVWMANQSSTYYVGGNIKNTGSRDLTVGLYNNASLIQAYTVTAGSSLLVSYQMQNIAKSGNISIRFTSTGVGTSFNLLDFRIGQGNQVFTANVFDELNMAPLGFNLTISNGTNSTLFANVANSLNRTSSELPTGDLSLTFSNVTCLTGDILPRVVQLSYLIGGVNATGYLLCDSSNPSLVSFNVEDARSARISGALVEAYKSISGSLQLVSSKLTDSSGVAGLYLDVNTNYNIRVTASGYNSYSAFLVPSSNSYTIVLTDSNSSIGFQTLYDGLYFQISPENSYLIPDVNNLSLLSFYLNDSLGLLNYWGWNVSFNSIQLYVSNLTPNASGGYEQVYLNLTNRTGGVVNVSYWFSRSNFTQWQLNRSYFVSVNNQSNASFYGALTKPKADGAPSFMMVVLSFVLISFVTALYNRYVQIGAGVVSLALWGFVAIMGYLSWIVFGIVAMAYAGYVVMARAY